MSKAIGYSRCNLLRMENPSVIPTTITKISNNTKQTIIVYGYSESDERKIPPPPDLTNTGPVGGPIVVRTDEVLIVAFVLILWAAAIALFFNRWGKIRMLEPYQPKFHEVEHRPSCSLNELTLTNPVTVAQHRTSLSKYNVTASCIDQLPCLYQTPSSARGNLHRFRQNSMFTSGANLNVQLATCCPRKTRSAIDINSLVQHDTATTSRPCTSMLPISTTDRRLSYAQHSATLKDKRSCSLFSHGGGGGSMHDRRRSCMGVCSIVSLRYRYGYRDSLSPHPPYSFRRISCAQGNDNLTCQTRERKHSFNNLLTQVTAERRPSSSMLRITNV